MDEEGGQGSSAGSHSNGNAHFDAADDTQKRENLLQYAGLQYSDQKELAVSLPHETLPGIMVGGPPVALPQKPGIIIKRVPSATSGDYSRLPPLSIPPRFKGIISFGSPFEPIKIPERLRGHVFIDPTMSSMSDLQKRQKAISALMDDYLKEEEEQEDEGDEEEDEE
ncbi:hypothetical protein BX600DRAFT_517564 [Xylariales sp. PMI_506]|nr:hypothetical protein BX600DRAFT_517564 [Xylariales sp. PMI_506]